jgi:hypothetical protein
MFENLKAELSPFYTNNGVHHLVFRFYTGANLQLCEFDAAFARYAKDYKPVPFRQKLKV